MPKTQRCTRTKRAGLSWCMALLTTTLTSFFNSAFADPQIRIAGPAGSHIVQGSGKATLNVIASLPDDSKQAQFTVSVVPFDSDGNAISAALASYRRSVSALDRKKAVKVDVTLPRVGFFRVDATLSSLAGKVLASTTTTLARTALRHESGPADFGVVTHFAQRKGAPPSVLLPLVKQAGFSWIRDELYWEDIEQQRGIYKFPTEYDKYLTLSKKLGISPLIVLDYGNPKAYPSLFASSRFPSTAPAREHFIDYVKAVVARYGGSGSSTPHRGLVKYWEVWNEPNFSTNTFTAYAALLSETFRALKAQDPQAYVVACGGGGAGGGPSGDCLSGLIKAGASKDFDGFSVHPYMSPNTPERGYEAKGSIISRVSIPTVWPHLNGLAERQHGPDGRPLQIWVTEIGWPVSADHPFGDETMQAAYFMRSYLLSRRYDMVRAMFWYDFVDDGTDPKEIEHNFGLLHQDLTPKPSFVAASVINSALGQRKMQNALIDRDDIKVYQYGMNDRVIVGWTIDRKPIDAAVTLSPGKYVLRDWQGVDTSVTIGKDAYSWKLGPLPQFLIPVAK